MKNQTLKLPIKNYNKSLKNFHEIKDQKISRNIKFLIIELISNLF